MRKSTVISVLVAAAVVSAAAGAWAQGGTYGGAVIGPGSPVAVLSGTSGGPRSASSMGSNCRGSIAVVPDHVIMVTAPMTVRIEVASQAGDTTLVVIGPSGVMCDDDSAGSLRPRVNQFMQPGQYQVYVGTYGGSSLYPYTLQVQGQGAAYGYPTPPPVATTGGRYGGAVLAPGNMYASLAGTSGGSNSASSMMGSNCRGYVDSMPDHVITVVAPMVLTFDVTSSGDTTLVVSGPGGVTCDDDGGGALNPRLTRPMQPGTYQVFVGSYSSGYFYPYALSIHP